MIKVVIKSNNGVVELVEVRGHAFYADAGYDIVCAAVSSIVQTTASAIYKFNEKSIYYEEAEGLVKIKVLNNNAITNKLLVNMIEMLEQVASDYPKNVNIRK